VMQLSLQVMQRSSETTRYAEGILKSSSARSSPGPDTAFAETGEEQELVCIVPPNRASVNAITGSSWMPFFWQPELAPVKKYRLAREKTHCGFESTVKGQLEEGWWRHVFQMCQADTAECIEVGVGLA
jgi:hypothetical protein